MQLVLDTQGLRLDKRNNCFHVSDKKQSRIISPLRITGIAIAQQCTITSAALLLAAEHQLPVLFFSRTGRVKARLWSPYYGNIATIRRQQTMYALTPQATEWITGLFRLKLKGQIHNLQALATRYPLRAEAVAEAIDKMNNYVSTLDDLQHKTLAECGNSIIGTEGSIARVYWRTVADSLPEQYRFPKRSRRPAQDRFNAALNYLYGMLYGTIEGACLATGLDPYLGFLHTDRHRQATFTFDLIEPFRPWVDGLLIDMCVDNALRAKHFKSPKSGGLILDKPAKALIIPAFNAFMEEKRLFEGKATTTRHHIHLFAANFAQFLLNENEIL